MLIHFVSNNNAIVSEGKLTSRDHEDHSASGHLGMSKKNHLLNGGLERVSSSGRTFSFSQSAYLVLLFCVKLRVISDVNSWISIQNVGRGPWDGMIHPPPYNYFWDVNCLMGLGKGQGKVLQGELKTKTPQVCQKMTEKNEVKDANTLILAHKWTSILICF